MSGKVVAVAQQKGGAGKTTVVAHLAVVFTEAGKSVAVIDIDPQQSLSQWYRMREARRGDAGAGVLASSIEGWRTRNEVRRLAESHDIVLVDSPPHAESEARIAIRAADLVVVPVQPSPMDVWATKPTLQLAEREKVPVLIVLNRVPPRAKLTEAMIAEVQSLEEHLADSRLGNRVAFAAALAEGHAVTEREPSGRASEEIRALMQEIQRRLH